MNIFSLPAALLTIIFMFRMFESNSVLSLSLGAWHLLSSSQSYFRRTVSFHHQPWTSPGWWLSSTEAASPHISATRLHLGASSPSATPWPRPAATRTSATELHPSGCPSLLHSAPPWWPFGLPGAFEVECRKKKQNVWLLDAFLLLIPSGFLAFRRMIWLKA